MEGMSWALGALIATDLEAVERFLEKDDNQIAARVRREVRNKSRTGLRNPDRRKRK